MLVLSLFDEVMCYCEYQLLFRLVFEIPVDLRSRLGIFLNTISIFTFYLWFLKKVIFRLLFCKLIFCFQRELKF